MRFVLYEFESISFVRRAKAKIRLIPQQLHLENKKETMATQHLIEITMGAALHKQLPAQGSPLPDVGSRSA